jgi:hypothetical protein
MVPVSDTSDATAGHRPAEAKPAAWDGRAEPARRSRISTSLSFFPSPAKDQIPLPTSLLWLILYCSTLWTPSEPLFCSSSWNHPLVGCLRRTQKCQIRNADREPYEVFNNNLIRQLVLPAALPSQGCAHAMTELTERLVSITSSRPANATSNPATPKAFHSSQPIQHRSTSYHGIRKPQLP